MKVTYFLLLTIGFFSWSSTETTTCDLRNTKYGFVCVCTAAYCDYLEDTTPVQKNAISIISSSKDGLRFASKDALFKTAQRVVIKNHKERLKEDGQVKENETAFEPVALLIDDGRALLQFAYGASSVFNSNNAATKSVTLTVNRAKKYQHIVGFGGAFTGSVSHILTYLDQELQDQIYRTYFHQTGIGFNLLRMSIGGCDFDLEPWAYNEQPRNDPQLSNFTKLDTRDELKVQQLERMKTISGLDKIKIMAAAWSSPTWMKSNNDWTGYSYLKPEHYQAWANYHLKFLELMDAKNMPIWAISTGNEPVNGVFGWFFVHFMSLGWTPKSQAIWLSENLGPTIKNSKKHRNVLIFGNDDQRYSYPAWFNTMKSSRSNSLDFLDGLAVHWYWDDVFGPSLIDEAHRLMPEKLLLNTESCVGDKPWQTHGPELGSWERGEQYMRGFLQDFQHAFNGWIDWNIVLDEQGGPNYVQNHVDAPIIVNTTSRLEFYKQPIFYAIGHFSKFIPEGSVRIATEVSNTNLDAVGFIRPDGTLAIVVYNSGRVPVDVALNDNVRGNIEINIPARSMHTLLYN